MFAVVFMRWKILAALVLGPTILASPSAFGACALSAIDACMREDPTEAEGTLLKEFGVTQDSGVAAQLGELYRNAGPPVQDDEKASYYLRRAANGGAIWSMIALADMLLKGKGSEPQPELAVELLEKASRTGDAAQMASAEASLGDYYRRAGEPRKALTAFETAAAGGAIWPAISLAQMLLEGEGVAADPPRAIALLQGAARNGDDAQMSAAEGALGAYYRRAGEPEKAVAAFRRAAASGGIWPKIMLAEMLLQGEGAETDTDRAIALLVEVSRTGDAAQVGSAQGILGQHYLATGQPAKAAEAFEAGANTGAVWPAISLAQILLAGTAGAADPARGIGLLEQAIQDGDAMQQASALGSLGSYYRSIGDTTKALAALERARELGVQAWPMVMLAEMVARGKASRPTPSARFASSKQRSNSMQLSFPSPRSSRSTPNGSKTNSPSARRWVTCTQRSPPTGTPPCKPLGIFLTTRRPR